MFWEGSCVLEKSTIFYWSWIILSFCCAKAFGGLTPSLDFFMCSCAFRYFTCLHFEMWNWSKRAELIFKFQIFLVCFLNWKWTQKRISTMHACHNIYLHFCPATNREKKSNQSTWPLPHLKLKKNSKKKSNKEQHKKRESTHDHIHKTMV